MRSSKPYAQFVCLRWDGPSEGVVGPVEADLCRQHREEISLAHDSARGCGKIGDECDLCKGRKPRPSSTAPLPPETPLGSPDSKEHRPAPSDPAER